MQKISKQAILSAKDSVKNANVKLTKIAQDMVNSETAPSPEQVQEIVSSIADVAQEIVQQADMVAQGLESVTGDSGNGDPPGIEPVVEPKPVVATMDDDTQKKLDAQDKEIDELKKFKNDNEKEKMASEYANLFPASQKSAKFNEFMKMDRPNSELSTVLSATESALTSLTKNASMRKSNETIIFKEAKIKNASLNGYGSNATVLSEI